MQSKASARFKRSGRSGRYAGFALTASSLLLVGCGLSGNSTIGSSSAAGTVVSGVRGYVHGGQQPVNGATIQLYTVGTGGAGSTSTPLITATVTTGSNGQFDITHLYSCNMATQVYIVATGGDAGAGNNSALSLMAALGPCSGLSSSTVISINELTTAAAVYALSPFMADFQDLGGTGANPAGLVNAFTTAQFLVNTTTGAIATPPSGVTLPSARLNTVADVLAACVNTNGSASTACTTLLNATSATETIGAGLAIAKNPGNPSLTALYSLASTGPPFVPTLTSQPNDLTLAINYTGPELKGPFGIAMDATGNAWVTNVGGSSIVKVPVPATAFVTTPYSNVGLLAPRGVSIDRTGNVWIANTGANNVVELSSSGASLSVTGAGTGGISGPVAIATDSAGNVWIANFFGNSITELSGGTATGNSPITGSGVLSAPSSIALDTSGRVAVANMGTGQTCLFSNAAVLQSCPSDGILNGATAVAVNSSGGTVTAGSTTGPAVIGAFTLGTTAGSVTAGSPVSGGGLVAPSAVAYDGGGVAWFANSASISAFAGGAAISGSNGWGSLNSPSGVAVDASGNVWTANTGDNSVSIFVGLATPVVTPIAASVGP